MAGTGLVLIPADWPAPTGVRALATTRQGGVSTGPFESLNLGAHVGDRPAAVAGNRERLRRAARLPEEPRWLSQVHGSTVAEAEGIEAPPPADAAATGRRGVVCAVLTADCLPILLCDREARRVAAVHAGWRGLAGGVVENAVADFDAHGVPPSSMLAWLGPAIGGAAYEVGADVREAFGPDDGPAFSSNRRGRWQLDLCGLAGARLRACGVAGIHGGGLCTASEPRRFFSHRRDGVCGRQAALIWLD